MINPTTSFGYRNSFIALAPAHEQRLYFFAKQVERKHIFEKSIIRFLTMVSAQVLPNTLVGTCADGLAAVRPSLT